MVDNLSWTEFCSLYYDAARLSAEVHLNKLRGKLGNWGASVDEHYVMDSAVLAGLEKTYASFNPSRGTKVKTLMDNIIHNEIVDGMEKEIRRTRLKVDERQGDVTPEDVAMALPPSAISSLMEKLHAAIQALSPSDQVIIGFYLTDVKTYIEKSVEALGVSENYVSVRRTRIFDRLPKLMGVSRQDYQEMYVEARLAGLSKCADPVSSRRNFICPDLDLDGIADMLCKRILAGI